MDVNSLTANKIKDLRLDTGKSQADIAKELGLSASAYLRLENGQVDINLKTVERIAEFYQISIGEVINQKSQNIYNCQHSHGVAIESPNSTFNYNFNVEAIEKAVEVMTDIVKKSKK
jgi:transcriptional regulator with XRE-family HTH domain